LKKRLANRKRKKRKRRAKYILVFLDNSTVLALHLGMSGKILIIKPGELYTLQKHDHLALSFDDGTQLIFNDARRFGMVFLIPEQKINAHPSFKNLGPEPLDNEFSGPVLTKSLEKRKGAIKTVLLDQKLVVGLGNIYVCEALFLAGINPQRSANTLQENQAEDLVRMIRDTLTHAIKAGGSTLRDYRHTDGDIGYFQKQLAVYGREGEACPDCHCDISKTGGIRRIIQAGRSTFFCERVQK
jgi:formamidopyrimidine-DNA glycosylase